MKSLNRLFAAGRKISKQANAVRGASAGVAMFEPLESRVMQSVSPAPIRVVSIPLVVDPIVAKYNALGGAGGFLGQPLGPEASTGISVANPLDPAEGSTPGSYQAYTNGDVFYSPATGAHEIHGAIFQDFIKEGGLSTLGYPTSDQTYTSMYAGIYNTFSRGGAIVGQYGTSQAYYLSPPIYTAWVGAGGWTGFSSTTGGFPTGDTQTYGNNQFAYFQREKIIDEAGHTYVVPNSSTMTSGNFTNVFSSNGDSNAVGNASLTVNQNGSYSLTYNFTSTSAYHFGVANYSVTVAVITPSGAVYTFSHSGSVSLLSNDTGTITGSDPRLTANWPDFEGSTFAVSVSVNGGGGSPSFGQVIQDAGTVIQIAGTLASLF